MISEECLMNLVKCAKANDLEIYKIFEENRNCVRSVRRRGTAIIITLEMRRQHDI